MFSDVPGKFSGTKRRDHSLIVKSRVEHVVITLFGFALSAFLLNKTFSLLKIKRLLREGMWTDGASI